MTLATFVRATAFAQNAWRVVVAIKHRRELARLNDLEDRMLADIGLRRSDLHAAGSLPLWQDPTSILNHRGPVACRDGAVETLANTNAHKRVAAVLTSPTR